MLHATVLTSSFDNSSSCFAAVDDVCCTPAHYATNHGITFAHLAIHKATAMQQVLALPPTDVVINLCDGAWDEDRAGVEVIHALHARGLPYTGADARCFDQPKPQQKAAATRVGVATAPGMLIEWDNNVHEVGVYQYTTINGCNDVCIG